MLTLTLPAHGSYVEIVRAVRECQVQIRIMRDSTFDSPVLEDDYSHARGRDEIVREIDRLEEYRQEWYRFETDSCYIDENGEVC
jgi:hypothetical protein